MNDDADEVLAPMAPVDLEGVERDHMLASLQARMFGASQTLRLGRFELGRRQGAGAMGVVYEARDPQLDRKVALKVLRSADLDPSRVERLVLEARSLAKLRHPNVVTVYEVGQDGEDRFIVMDLVQGDTLRTWLETPRSWQEIVRMFIGAGEGLRAAHEAGLVHRDFKPDNVLVEDGQPKVVDFGLAATVGDSLETTLTESLSDAPALERFTQTAAFVGTPAYMAPEQFRGQVTPAADQYAFCLALYEALAGRRPHAEAEASGIEAMIAARTNPPSTGGPERAPRWLRRVLARGLDADPSRRWPSMSVLLGALRRVDGEARRRVLGGATVLGLVTLAAGLGSRVGDEQADPCADAADPMHAAWSVERRETLGRAFAQTELTYADDTWQRVVPILSAYASDWAQARARACAADLAAPEPLPPLNAARVQCLDRRRADFESLLATFAAPDAKIVDRAVDAASTIPLLDQCDEAVLLRAQMEREHGFASAPPELYAALSAADAAFRTGDDAGALRRAEQVVREAEAAEDPELIALGALVLAKATQRSGALGRSVEAAELAVEAAERLGDTRLRVRAQLRLLALLTERREFGSATRLARFVGAAMNRLQDAVPLVVELRELESTLLLYQGKPKEALEHLEPLEPLLEDRPDLRGSVLDQRGQILEELGRHEAAADVQREAVERLADRLGAATPRVIEARAQLATSLSNMGRTDEGVSEARRTVADAEAVLGPASLLAERARGTLAIALATAGRAEEAEPLLRQAARDIETRLGSKHPRAADGWINLAHVLPYLERSDEAVEVLEHAKEILLHTLPEDHLDFVFIHANLAEAHVELGHWDEALRAARAAEAIGAEQLGNDTDRMSQIHTLLGSAQRGAGALADSRATLEAVVAGLEQTGGRRGRLGLARYELALTEAADGKLAAATSLMHAARRDFEADGSHEGYVKEVDTWLREH